MSNTGGAQTNFGSTWSCVTDVTMPSVMVSGNTAVAQALIHRWITPAGRLLSDPNFGYDLTDYINASLTPAEVSKIAGRAAAEAQKDERVIRASVTLTFSIGTLMLQATILTANGPFQMVAAAGPGVFSLLQVTPSQ
jgi:phage baseplate assembly protein W